MRNRVRLSSFLAALFLIAGAITASAQDVGVQVSGTYRIAVCKSVPCTPGDSVNAVAWGRLMLFDSALHLSSFPPSLLRVLYTHNLRSPANGCYALLRRSPEPQTYAGGSGAGTTRWDRDSGSDAISFTLYRSPDARHVVHARITGDSLHGFGESSGAGVAEVHWPNDTIVAVRIGPPDYRNCADPNTLQEAPRSHHDPAAQCPVDSLWDKSASQTLSERIALRIPEFGGAYRDTAMVVLLTDVTAGPRIAPALREELENAGRNDLALGQFKYVKATYPLRTLRWWRICLRPSLGNGVSSLGVNEFLNRVEVGVIADSVRPRVEREMARLGISREAVVFRRKAYVHPLD